MRKLLPVALCMGLICALTVGLVGCGDKKDKDKDKDKAKTTTTTTTTKPVDTPKENKITLEAAPTSVTIKQGEKGESKITLTREKKADKEVKLTAALDKADKGVSAKLDPDSLKGDAKDAKLWVTATDAAEVGEYTVIVTGKSEGSDDASSGKITFKVEAKPAPKVDPKGVSLSPDKATLKVEQGGKNDTALKLEYKGGAKDAKVTLKDKGKGITVTIEVNKAGDSAKITVAADADAKEGDQTIIIEATAEGAAASASTTITVTVEKKKAK